VLALGGVARRSSGSCRCAEHVRGGDGPRISSPSRHSARTVRMNRSAEGVRLGRLDRRADYPDAFRCGTPRPKAALNLLSRCVSWSEAVDAQNRHRARQAGGPEARRRKPRPGREPLHELHLRGRSRKREVAVPGNGGCDSAVARAGPRRRRKQPPDSALQASVRDRRFDRQFSCADSAGDGAAANTIKNARAAAAAASAVRPEPFAEAVPDTGAATRTLVRSRQVRARVFSVASWAEVSSGA
jgi:hypothetical protein